MSAADRLKMHRLFRDYLDTRLQGYANLADRQATEQAFARAGQFQQEIWSRAIVASQADPSQNISRVLLPALNEMIDITTERTTALHVHLPTLVFVLLTAVALLSALIAGYAMSRRQRRSWLHSILYAAVISVTVYTVLDLDHPRNGLVNLDVADNALRQLRASMQ